MASSSSFLSPHLLGFLVLLLLLNIQTSFSLTCTSQTLPKNKLFQHCTDLPLLSSYLHWTYNSSKPSLTMAFIATPAKPNGWISWAINPTALKMIGSQSLIAFMDSNGVMTVQTFNVSSYGPLSSMKIAFEVTERGAESLGGVMSLYATIVLPKDMGPMVNQVWQVGSSVTNGIPDKHGFTTANLNSMGTIDFSKGANSVSRGGGGSRLRKKNIHGILNAVSWGIMFPIGIIIARYLRIFQSADPAWFYLHVFCQFSAYVIGVAGWGTGLKLGSQSKGVTYSTHRNIRIALFNFATL